MVVELLPANLVDNHEIPVPHNLILVFKAHLVPVIEVFCPFLAILATLPSLYQDQMRQWPKKTKALALSYLCDMT